MGHLCLVMMLISAASASDAESCRNGGSDSTCSMDDDVNLIQTRTKVHIHAKQGKKQGKDGLSLKLTVHPKDRVGWNIHAGANGPISIVQKHPGEPNDRVGWDKGPVSAVQMDARKLLTARDKHPVTTETLSDKDVKEIEDILKEAGKLTGDKEALKDEKEIEEADKKGGHDAVGKLVEGYSKDHQEMMKAVEEVSANEDVEDMLDHTGSIVTGDVLQKLDDKPGTPEQLPADDDDKEVLGLLSGHVVEGDMIGGSEESYLSLLQAAKAHKRWAGTLWKNNMAIPYCFASALAPTSKKAFQDAVEHWQEHVPCLAFKEVAVGDESKMKCAEQPGIFVTSHEGGCYAHVGEPYKWNGEYYDSVCHLAPNGCDTLGIAAHEIGHNIGMLHEQSRSDHDKYVTIKWDNIEPDMRSQYAVSEKVDKSIPYDIMSLMHYSDTAFGLPGKKTMIYAANSDKIMGNRMGLTMADVKQAAAMYGCEDAIKEFKLCSTNKDKCTEDACTCHEKSSSFLSTNGTTHGGGGGSGAIKIVSKDGKCQQCAPRCPDYNYGSPSFCGCPVGCTTGSWTSGDTKYTYCKDCSVPPPSPPPPSPPPPSGDKKTTTTTTMTAAPTTTTTPPPPPDPCADHYSFCGQFLEYCGPWTTLTVDGVGHPIMDVCPTTCCAECAGCPEECADDFGSTCEFYGTQYCPFDGVTLNGIPYKDACKKTCGGCDS